MDQFDQAQELDARYREQALALHRERQKKIGDTMTHCMDCGDEIPEARRQLLPGVTRCVSCAAVFEQHTRRI